MFVVLIAVVAVVFERRDWPHQMLATMPDLTLSASVSRTRQRVPVASLMYGGILPSKNNILMMPKISHADFVDRGRGLLVSGERAGANGFLDLVLLLWRLQRNLLFLFIRFLFPK